MVTASVVREIDDVRPYLEAWDHLAVLRGQPYSAPAWMLAWWRHLAPGGGHLTLTVVRDNGEVIGLAPWYQVRRRTGLRVARLLGSGHRVEPLCVPGREQEVAQAMATALRSVEDTPSALLLDRADAASSWPGLLKETWAGRSAAVWSDQLTAPTLMMGGRTYEEWEASRSGNFRSQRKRARRKFAERGVQARLVHEGDDLNAAVLAFMLLHHSRWDRRATASGLPKGTEGMLRESARELVPAGRMRIWLLEAGGVPISAQIFLTAGGETAYWNGGFDPEWSELRPGFEALAYAVEHAFGEGDRRVDFGGGAQSYKSRLADGDDPLASSLVLTGGTGRSVRAAQLMPERIGRVTKRLVKGLPSPLQRQLRAVRGVLARSAPLSR